MSMRTKTTCLSAAIVLAVTMTPRALIAQAGPPLLTDDPETPGNNKWEINIAAIILQRRTERLWSIPLLDINYGLGERIQLKAEIPWMVLQSRSGGRNQTGPGSANVGVKWRFLDRKRHGFAMSTYPQLEFRTSAASVRKGLSETGAELRLPVELSREFGPVTIVGEVGYQIVQRQKDEWIYGVAVAHEINQRIELLGEIHGESQRDLTANQIVFNVGGRYKLTEHHTLLFSSGRSLRPASTRQPTWVAYLGIQIHF